MILGVIFWSCLLVISSATDPPLPCEPPCENGQCIADHGELSCRCDPNYFGERCDQFVCERETGLCLNGGSCVMDRTNSSVYHCVCPLNVMGEQCQYIVHSNSCTPDTCNGKGYCYGNSLGSTDCVCHTDYYGDSCQFPHGPDPCLGPHVQNCFGKGSCGYSDDGDLACSCYPDYQAIQNCEVLVPYANSCNQLPCQNGGSCQSPAPYNYTCICPANFSGVNCTEPFDPCNGTVCQNGGTCNSIHNGHYFQCMCPPSHTGQWCEELLLEEPSNCSCPSCQSCLTNGSSSTCQCLSGCVGEQCEIVDTCGSLLPCSNHTQAPHCLNTNLISTGYVCTCAEGWGGPTCQYEVNECSPSPCNAGECVALPGGFQCNCPDGTTGNFCDSEREACPLSDCQGLSANGQCDTQCDLPLCNFDGFDCDVPDPWSSCPTPAECRDHFSNGICDIGCNSASCLYDGGECSPSNCDHLDECRDVVADDGVCMMKCSTPLCPYDYNDCFHGRTFARNRLVLILLSEPNEPFVSPWKDEFLRDLGAIIHSIPLLVESVPLSLEDLDEELRPSTGNKLIFRVVLELDISRCDTNCPLTSEEAVLWLYARILRVGANVGPYSVEKASTEPDPPPPSTSLSWWLYMLIIMAIVLVGASLVVVMILGKRRRVTAKIWRPKSPSSESERNHPPVANGGNSGGTITGTESSSQGLECKDYMEKGSKKAKMTSNDLHVEWSDDSVPLTTSSNPPPPSPVVIGQQGRDARRLGVAHTSDVTKLVQQYRRQNGSSLNINAPGPGGFTPLMLAVMRRPGTYACFNYQSRSSSESSSDDQAALLPPVSSGTPRHFVIPPVDSSVSMLIQGKADLGAVNDYNQSALHLAAACSRAAYVDQLLEAGANPNVQDNWGQNALHAAIGASAEGAFMVLLNHPQTMINLKSDGGITPLMAAVKMVNIFMVTQLLKKDSDIISATDNDGRTAVHWAAMVDNLDALRMLVSRGPDTIKDTQDCKGQTALFLACREGSIMCARHLIDCFANVTLYDNLDQSPLQIAKEKQCHEIVELLMASTHVPYTMHPPHGPAYTEMVPFPPPPTQHPLVMPSTSKKKKSKLTATGSQHQLLQQQIHTTTSSSSSSSSPFPPHQSPPNHYLSPTSSNYASSNVTHSPPLPQQPPISAYPSTSINTHRRYSNATPPEASYSNPTPPSYDPHQDLPTSSAAPPNGAHHHHPAVENGYPMYSADGGPGTRPLQHMSMGTEVGMQTSASSFLPGQGGVYSPPQSGGSLSQKSPTSTFPSPPNCGASYGASPQSLTPSPDAPGTINALGTVHIEGSYGYNPYSMPPQYLIGSTAV